MMEWIFRCLAVCTLLGGCASAPRGSLRDLNGQINLLRTYFQREIENLRFEMFDLKTELNLEKAKTARLEDLLNGTVSIAELGTDFHDDVSQKYVGNSRNVEDEDVKIETEVAELSLVKETIAQLEDAVRDNKKNVEEVQEIARTLSIDMRNEIPKKQQAIAKLEDAVRDNSNTIVVVQEVVRNLSDDLRNESLKEQQALGHSLSVVNKAFIDEKDRCNTIEAKLLMMTEEEINRSALINDKVDTLQTDIQLVKKETKKSSRDITDVHTYLTQVSERTNESAKSIVNLQNDMQLVRDELNNSNTQLGQVQDMLHDMELVTTQHTEALDQHSETLAPIKKAREEEEAAAAAAAAARKQRCLSIINAGGQGMAKLLYVGVTVKRGVDWRRGDEDVGGEGVVTRVNVDRLARGYPVKVRWGNGNHHSYRMGYNNAYELMIVADKYDFSRCPP